MVNRMSLKMLFVTILLIFEMQNVLLVPLTDLTDNESHMVTTTQSSVEIDLENTPKSSKDTPTTLSQDKRSGYLQNDDMYVTYVEEDYNDDDNEINPDHIVDEDTSDSHIAYSDDPYADDHVPVTVSDDQKEMKMLTFTKMLLNGTPDEVKMIPRNIIIPLLGAINKLNITLSKQLVIWNILKSNRSVKELTRSDLETTGNLLLIIPQLDFYNLNYSDWNVIDYLGELKGINRRQAGIIGYAIKRKWGDDILSNMEYINRLKGLICAFSPQELLGISPQAFCLFSQEVFENIGSCTERQLRVLVHSAMLSTVYGPTQAWSMNDTAKLALLVKSLPMEDLKSLRPPAMEGINYTVIEVMSKEQLETFDEAQLSYLNDNSLAVYRRITGINSNYGNAVHISELLSYSSYGITLAFYFLNCWTYNTIIVIQLL